MSSRFKDILHYIKISVLKSYHIEWWQTGYVMRNPVSNTQTVSISHRVLWAPIDKLPSSLLNESPPLAQKKSVGYHPMMKCKQAIIDSHCCCALGGGARQSPHPDGSGSHRTPSRLKVTPRAHTYARTSGTKPINHGTSLRTAGTLQWHRIGHTKHQIH